MEDKFAGTNINPAWLDPKNSGMFGIVESALNSAIRKYKLSADPDEFLDHALMGLSPDLTKIREVRPAWHAGMKGSEGIKSGKETPRSIGAGPLATYLIRFVKRESDKIHSLMIDSPETDERPIDYADTSAEESSAGSFLTKLVFEDMDDPMGKRIREFMKKVWKSKYPDMVTWLTMLEKGTLPKTKQDFAKSINKVPEQLQDIFNPAWKTFAKALWSGSGEANKLLEDLELYFMSKRVPWFYSEDQLLEVTRQKVLNEVERLRPTHKKSFLWV
jgi:hypothetical protein